MKILLVDDQAMFREMLRDRLAQEYESAEIFVASEAAEGAELAHEHDFELVVLDIDMPGTDVFDSASRIAKRAPSARIVFLSAHTYDSHIERALAVGARGFISKDEPADAVVEALGRVLDGKAFFSKTILARLVLEDGEARLPDDPKTKFQTLTPREREVLVYIARGYTKREIGEMMHVGTKTVEKHTENVMAKLDIHDRVRLARFAIREQLIDP